MAEPDGSSWAPLGIPPSLHLRLFPSASSSFTSSSSPSLHRSPFPAFSLSLSPSLRRAQRARQINSLRFSAFQLPLPPLPDHVVYLCRRGRSVRDVLAGPFVGLSTREREIESGKRRRDACTRRDILFPRQQKGPGGSQIMREVISVDEDHR